MTYKLYNGDMLKELDKVADGSVDMILTDLPYGTTSCSWDNIIPFDKMWEQYNRVIKENGAIVLFGSEPFSSNLRLSNLENYKYDWIWIKEKGTGFARSRKQPMRKHENISVFYKQQPKYDYVGEELDKPYTRTLPIVKSETDSVSSNNLNDGERIYVEYTHKTKHNILEYARNTKGGVHPTQKPVALLEHLIETYTKKNETVLDSTMGSGSTGVACLNTDRQFIGVEMDKDYFEIAKERMKTNEKQMELF